MDVGRAERKGPAKRAKGREKSEGRRGLRDEFRSGAHRRHGTHGKKKVEGKKEKAGLGVGGAGEETGMGVLAIGCGRLV